MSATMLLEIGQIVGLIASVWFGLVGWKLVPLFWLRGPFPTQPYHDK